MSRLPRFFVLLSCVGVSVPAFAGKLEVDQMFSDHMVLQRDLAVPIWGVGKVGETVTVQFRDQSKTAKVGGDGKWMLKLESLEVGDPAELTVSGGGEAIVFTNVLVGEVWLGSGQSNMAGRVLNYAPKDSVLKKAADGNYPDLRLYHMNQWRPAGGGVTKNFSALMFAFGLNLHQELGVPVGVIVGAVGGSPSGEWLSVEMLEASAEAMEQMKTVGGFESFAEIQAAYEAKRPAWQIEVEKAKTAGEKRPRFDGPMPPGGLYRRFIEPKAPYGIRGVLWDQGESGVRVPGVDQYTAMKALITGWRGKWGQGDFPFLHMQKPSGGGCAFDTENPVNTGANEFSEKLPGKLINRFKQMSYDLNHIKMGTIKNAPLVPIGDLAPGIHPECKSGYGKRASQVALGAVYGEDVSISGPVYASHKIEGSNVRVKFNHVGKGLVHRHADSIRGFALCGADKRWFWAEAEIDGDSVVVSSPDVPEPVHVQYAFRRNANFANLFNRDGLPAIMFMTGE